MSKLPPSKRRRGSKQLRVRRPYTDFAAAELPESLDAKQLARRHLGWLLANLDYFAGQDRATLFSLNRALQDDLELLGLVPRRGIGKAEYLAQIEKLEAREKVYDKAISYTWMALEKGAIPNPNFATGQHARLLQTMAKYVYEAEVERMHAFEEKLPPREVTAARAMAAFYSSN